MPKPITITQYPIVDDEEGQAMHPKQGPTNVHATGDFSGYGNLINGAAGCGFTTLAGIQGGRGVKNCVSMA
jgi:hypothetical protein